MKKFTIFVFILFTIFSSVRPVLAETNSGIKPGNFFYFFDTAFEKINLFFTFNPEKKAQKALKYADERLAEIKDITMEEKSPNTPDTIKTVLANYENNINLAIKESKNIKDEEQLKTFLELFKNITTKNQGEISAFFTKIQSDAKEKGVSMEFLKKMQEFYGNSLPPEDLESLKEIQEQGKGLIRQGEEIPSVGTPLNLEDIKKLQEQLKMSPEQMELYKKMQEQGQFENAPPAQIPQNSSGTGGGSGMGI